MRIATSFRERLTYANVMATLAMFLVLGGGAYAATRLPKNSVGTKQVKNGAITLQKLSKSAQQSLKGAIGPPGAAGAPGAPGATNVIVRTGPAGARSVASCKPGEVATGGGGFTDPEEPKSFIFNSTPVEEEGQVPHAWEAQSENVLGEAVLVEAYVICASP